MSRVLLVSGPATGGIRRHLEALGEGLPPRGFELALAAPASLQAAAPTTRFVLDLGDRPRPLRDLGTLIALQRVVRRWRPALVHAHGVKAALVALASLRDTVPIVVTYHNLWLQSSVGAALRALAPATEATITVSEAVRESLTEGRIELPRCAVIPNGVDLEHYHVWERSRDPSAVTVAFVGRLAPVKGIRDLVAAWEELGPPSGWRLLVAGDGPLRSEVEAAAKRVRAVRCLGPVAEPRAVYMEADLVVVPSLLEGQSITALEAMASGIPVIASAVGGLPEVVVHGETGLLVPPLEPEALAGAIRSLALDPERRRAMGEAGRRRVEAQFSSDQMLDCTAGLYESVLALRTHA